jgi:quercetin dioxygenase-like cupin family protein
MHSIIPAARIQLIPEYSGNSRKFRRGSLVSRAVGSVHMGLGLCALESGGSVDAHVHSFEESFYVVDGDPTLVLDGRSYPLARGACGVVPVSVPHAWLGPPTGCAHWIDMLAPQPRVGDGADDTFFIGPPPADRIEELDIRDPRFRHLFRIDEGDIALENLRTGAPIDAPTVSASMATALLAYSGITVKMLVDQRLDAQLSTMFMVEYQPGGVAHPHDHPFEESYYMLDGEIEAVADGQSYVLRRGDLFWTGVGSVHAFYNRSNRTVRWLETQAPQPPARHSYRFSRDWEYLKQKLAATARVADSRDVIAKDVC